MSKLHLAGVGFAIGVGATLGTAALLKKTGIIDMALDAYDDWMLDHCDDEDDDYCPDCCTGCPCPCEGEAEGVSDAQREKIEKTEAELNRVFEEKQAKDVGDPGAPQRMPEDQADQTAQTAETAQEAQEDFGPDRVYTCIDPDKKVTDTDQVKDAAVEFARAAEALATSAASEAHHIIDSVIKSEAVQNVLNNDNVKAVKAEAQKHISTAVDTLNDLGSKLGDAIKKTVEEAKGESKEGTEDTKGTDGQD